MELTLLELKNNYNNGLYKNKMEYPSQSKFKENYVFDENKSVKWNKEEVIRQNKLIEQYKEKYHAESNRLSSNLYDDAVKAIMDEFTFNREQATEIWNYAYAEKHSHMSDVFGFADELAELIERVMKSK